MQRKRRGLDLLGLLSNISVYVGVSLLLDSFHLSCSPLAHSPRTCYSCGLQIVFPKLEERFHVTWEKSEDRERGQSCTRYWLGEIKMGPDRAAVVMRGSRAPPTWCTAHATPGSSNGESNSPVSLPCPPSHKSASNWQKAMCSPIPSAEAACPFINLTWYLFSCPWFWVVVQLLGTPRMTWEQCTLPRSKYIVNATLSVFFIHHFLRSLIHTCQHQVLWEPSAAIALSALSTFPFLGEVP